MIIATRSVLMVLLGFSIISCVTTPKSIITTANKASIDKVAYALENRNPDTFAEGLNKSGATVFFEMVLWLSGEGVSYEDVSRCELSSIDSNVTWTLDVTRSISIAGKLPRDGNLVHASRAPFFGHAFPIGRFVVRVIFYDGSQVEKSFTIGLPNGRGGSGVLAIYSENFPPTQDSSFVPMMFRPQIVSAKRNKDSLEVQFKTTSSDVYNGSIEFYNAKREFVAGPIYFRDPKTLHMTTELNGGSEIDTQGQENIFSIDLSKMPYVSGRSENDIALGIIRLLDGKQYSLTSIGRTNIDYDFYSCSENFQVKEEL